MAREWSQTFNADIRPVDINCVGCPSDTGPLFGYCATCGIRVCAREHGIETCVVCADYPCEQPTRWFSRVPEAKATLEKMRGAS